MDKDFENFGGWLKVFYILCLLNIFISIVAIFILSGEFFNDARPFLEVLLDCSKIGISAYLLYKIVEVIKIPQNSVPEYIKDRLYYLFVLSILYFLLFAIVTFPDSNWSWQPKHTETLLASLQTMIWSAIWRTYFEKSDRVSVFYSQNEETGKNIDTYE